MSYVEKLHKQLRTSKDPINIIKKIEEHENNIFNKIQYHEKVYELETSPKGKYSKGYSQTMKRLNGGLFGRTKKNRKENEKFVKNIFEMAKSDPKNVYHKGSLKAIMDLKKHNNKDGLNIYFDPIKKRK